MNPPSVLSAQVALRDHVPQSGLRRIAAPRAQPSKASTASQSEAAIEVNEGLTASLAFQGQNVLSFRKFQEVSIVSPR